MALVWHSIVHDSKETKEDTRIFKHPRQLSKVGKTTCPPKLQEGAEMLPHGQIFLNRG
jgi:hypothetical protein